jgi:hypothetical protein
MLRKKHYAQKNNSKGTMNTRSVARSTSNRINKLLSCGCNEVQTLYNETSSNVIERKKLHTIECADISQNSGICPNYYKNLNHYDSQLFTENYIKTLCLQ